MADKTIRVWNRKGNDAVDVLYVENIDPNTGLGDGTYSQSVVTSGDSESAGLTDAELRATPVPVMVTYAPVGAHSSGTAISSVVTLTKPTGASKILIQALTKNIRFTLDGTSPTATLGFQILAGGAPMIIEVPGASIKVIEESATASMQYQWVS